MWTDVATVLAGQLPMWAGDVYFLPPVFAATPRPFHAVMPYVDGQPVGFSYTGL